MTLDQREIEAEKLKKVFADLDALTERRAESVSQANDNAAVTSTRWSGGRGRKL